MAKLSAHGAREIARFSKSGGDTVVLTKDSKGRTRSLRKWTKGVTFAVATIPVGHKTNGGPIYSDRPTREQFEEWALANGYGRDAVRR